ncbi:hypothetical protein [Streptomyces tropicalis]|uniref:Uncharacterized protein n=1 Tax=Streptomyces tropicalis TaxID=3034234 RepID=A0ABT5ZZI7_9ACTN|nr:hypothetical protein [Streptomyces tropicalis]MDF3297546.1 hypothetical protein [Streptomyces tropicalis]
MSTVRCPSPTCHDTMQEFRGLRDGEITAAGDVLLPLLDGRRFAPSAYHRCTAGGCRRVQSKNNWRLGGFLPPGFAIPTGC